jgi:putative endonuclease
MSYFTYILECSDGKYYTGFTDDLDARVIAHNTGEYPNAYT